MRNVNAVKYLLLPGKNPSTEDRQYHQLAFDFWFQHWTEFFKISDPTYCLRADEFFRQDYIGLLVDNDTPLAIHLYSEFDITLPYQLNHSYLAYNFSKKYFSSLQSSGIRTGLSFEAMMINPKFRKTETGRSLGPILFGAGIQLLKNLNHIDAMIAPARNDIGVTKLAHSGGAITVTEKDLHGIPVSLIVGRKSDMHLNFLNDVDRQLVLRIFNEPRNLLILKRKEMNATSKKIAG